MTILASINLRKCFNSQPMRARLGRWLVHNHVQIFFAQEPWKRPDSSGVIFADLIPIGGSGKVFAWIDSQLELPQHQLLERFWQRIELGYLVVYNVYLDAYEQTCAPYNQNGCVRRYSAKVTDLFSSWETLISRQLQQMAYLAGKQAASIRELTADHFGGS